MMLQKKNETYHLRITDASGGLFCLNVSIVKGVEVYISPCFSFSGFRNKRKSSLHDKGQSHLKWDFKKTEWQTFSEEHRNRLSTQILLSEPRSLSVQKNDDKLIACQNITIHESALHTNQVDRKEKENYLKIDLKSFNAVEVLFVTHLYGKLRIPEEQKFETIKDVPMANKTLTMFMRRINLTGKEKVFENWKHDKNVTKALDGPSGLVALEAKINAIVGQLYVSSKYLQNVVISGSESHIEH